MHDLFLWPMRIGIVFGRVNERSRNADSFTGWLIGLHPVLLALNSYQVQKTSSEGRLPDVEKQQQKKKKTTKNGENKQKKKPPSSVVVCLTSITATLILPPPLGRGERALLVPTVKEAAGCDRRARTSNNGGQ